MTDYASAWLDCEKLLRDEEMRSRKLLEALEKIKHPMLRLVSEGLSTSCQNDQQIASDAITSYEQSKKKEEPK